jgi:hypothetical protein
MTDSGDPHFLEYFFSYRAVFPSSIPGLRCVMALDEKPDVKLDEAAFERPSVQSDSDVPREGPMSVEERRLLRKLDRRILPITCLLYLFACPYFVRFGLH